LPGDARAHRSDPQASGKYRPGAPATVDTRQDPEAGQRLREWWAKVALERLEHRTPGLFSFNLFTVSEADLERLRALHLAYFRELRGIVASSFPPERVVLANVQLLALDSPAPQG